MALRHASSERGESDAYLKLETALTSSRFRARGTASQASESEEARFQLRWPVLSEFAK
jgi:hypothetical protein